MEVNSFTFPNANRGSVFELVGLGDIHFGTESCDVKKLKRMVEWIRNRPNCFWVGLGDYTDNITYRDMRRFQPANISREYKIGDLQNWCEKITTDVAKILRPIAGRCIGLAQGNHEFDADRNYDHDSTQSLCDKLGVKNLGWTCLTRLVFNRVGAVQKNQTRTLILLTEHSNVAGRKKGGKVNRIEDRASDFEFDIILWGHSHDKVGSKKTRLFLPSRGKLEIKAHEMVFGIVPSFLRTYEVGTTSYGERAGYSPTSLGIVLITIKPFAVEMIDGKQTETYQIHISQ
jgi:predicted phosphodiesterase